MNHPAGKPVLITGCSSGIGRCLALGLRARGYWTFAAARHRADLRDLADAGCDILELDVNRSESIVAAVDLVLERTGGHLYGLCNNAGYEQPGAVEDLSRDALRRQLETNLLGAHELTCRVLPAMRRQGEGRIIQMSSVLGLVALPLRGAYVASKFALEGLTDVLRLELMGSGLYVSLVEPGPIDTPFRSKSWAAFQSGINPEASPHAERYRILGQRLTAPGPKSPFMLPPEAVLKRVLHALESRRPKPRYYLTLPTRALVLVRRLLSTRQLDWLLARIAGPSGH